VIARAATRGVTATRVPQGHRTVFAPQFMQSRGRNPAKETGPRFEDRPPSGVGLVQCCVRNGLQ